MCEKLRQGNLTNFSEQDIEQFLTAELIVQQGLNTPHKTAVIAFDGVLTYHELLEQSKLWARYLKEKGKEGYWEDTSGGDITQTAVQFTLKANPMYRNFGIGGEPKKK